MRGLFTRAIRPSGVGSDAVPGDPHGVLVGGDEPPPPTLTRIVPSPWSGWPADWQTPAWGHVEQLTDTAWACLDLNASVLASMPPYLVDAAPSLNADWLTNPDPDVYTSWEEFAKQLFWSYQAEGEVFVLATARYATGWPARFHVLPGFVVEVEIGADGRRVYEVGRVPVAAEDILHVRYSGSVDDAHGHGPLEAGAARLVAAQVLSRYASNLAASGGVPASILRHPEELTAEQALQLQQQWVAARQSSIGEPAVLSGGLDWQAVQLNPEEMALVDLSKWNEARIAILLGVPPPIVGLPSGGDSLTYSNTSALFDYHWRAGLRPKAQTVMSAMSGWLLPRGTSVELNRDAYVQQEPQVRAQTYQILNQIRDEQGNPVLSVAEIRAAERLDQISTTKPQQEVLQ